MTGLKQLDRVHDTTVLASVFWQCLMQTHQASHIKFIIYMIQSEHLAYALYQPTNHYVATPDEGNLVPTTYITSANWQDMTQLNCWSRHRTGMSGENLCSNGLTHSSPVEREKDSWLLLALLLLHLYLTSIVWSTVEAQLCYLYISHLQTISRLPSVVTILPHSKPISSVCSTLTIDCTKNVLCLHFQLKF